MMRTRLGVPGIMACRASLPGIGALGVVASLLAGCTFGSSHGARGPSAPPWRGPVAQPAGPPGGAGQFRAHRPRRVEMSRLKLPGASQERTVRYEVVDGMAVAQGDILLGPADRLAQRYGAARPRGGFGDPAGVGAKPVVDKSLLWPGGVIPYEVDASVPADRRSEIEWARGEMAAVGIQLRPRTASDVDYVVFRDTGDGCNSQIGRFGGAQPINLTNCAERVTLHEIMHAVGFQHEHARADRDSFVTINWDEIRDDMRHAFEKSDGGTEDFGPYDYHSVVHYPSWTFSKTGNSTIVARAPGVELGPVHGVLSDLDKDGIRHLYGPRSEPPPTQPATNPWGLPPGFPQPPPGIFPGQGNGGQGGNGQPAPSAPTWPLPGGSPGTAPQGWPPIWR